MQAKTAIVCLCLLMAVSLLSVNLGGIEGSKEPGSPLRLQLASDKYIFVRDTSRLVARASGNDLLPVGYLDDSNSFIEKTEYPGMPNPMGHFLSHDDYQGTSHFYMSSKSDFDL